jgi:hypothetical protein
LRRLEQRLDTIRVTAEQSRKRQRTYIDADAIAESTRPLFDAIDVVEKLRPNMTLEAPDLVGACMPMSNLFVNGKRYHIPPPASVSGKKPPRVIRSPANLAAMGAPTARPGKALAGAAIEMIVLLNSIKPEHIASLEYHDCMDRSIEGGESAFFVTLKDGIGFSYGSGSYVIPDSAASGVAQRLGLVPQAAHAPAPTSAPALEPFRLRILGVFDALTGDFLPGAEVLDLATGTHATTTETGTVSLAFMQVGHSKVAISKTGFRSDTLSINIAPTDTVPITVALKHLTP